MKFITNKQIFEISSIVACLLGVALSFHQGNKWPSGSYGLPKPKSGCPRGENNNKWYEGWKLQYIENVDKSLSIWPRVSNGSHMDVEFNENGRNLNRTFCMKKDNGIEPRYWPKGSYCIYKSKAAACPHNMSSGWIKWDGSLSPETPANSGSGDTESDDEDYGNIRTEGGLLPDGLHDNDGIIKFCCQTDGQWYNSIELPVSQPFYLLASNSTSSPKCQMVKWAYNYLEHIVFDTDKQTAGGDHLFLRGNGPKTRAYYCYYKDCRTTMTGLQGSFSSHPKASSKMDSQYCSWLITLATTAAYVVSLSFKDLSIPSCDGTFLKIYDGSNDTAMLLGTYCGSNATTQVKVVSSTSNLYIVSNSGSYKNHPKQFSFHAQYNATKDFAVKKLKEDHSFMIATAVGVFLVIVLFIIIIILIKHKRRKRAPELSTPVSIPPETNRNLQESLHAVVPVNDQELHNETVVQVHHENPDDTMTKKSEATTSFYEEVDLASTHKASGYTELDTSQLGKMDDNYEPLLKENDRYMVPGEPRYEVPGQKRADKPKIPPQNSEYTALQGRSPTDDVTYQKLIKRDTA